MLLRPAVPFSLSVRLSKHISANPPIIATTIDRRDCPRTRPRRDYEVFQRVRSEDAVRGPSEYRA